MAEQSLSEKIYQQTPPKLKSKVNKRLKTTKQNMQYCGTTTRYDICMGRNREKTLPILEKKKEMISIIRRG